MIGQFLLAFREALEAALIISIILAYLRRTGRKRLLSYSMYGVYIAITTSFVIGAVVWFLFGDLSGPAKALFEGIAAVIAASVLSSMIIWMARKGREIKRELEKQIEAAVARNAIMAIVGFTFVVVFREGLETVLFLTPFLVEDVAGTLIGATIGIALALILAYGMFIFGMKLNLGKFFFATSILLVLLAGGLIGYGVHELLEYSKDIGLETGWFGSYAYVLDISESSLLHHKGIAGSVLAVLFGYTIKAEWLRLIAHLCYLAGALPLIIRIYKRP
ncbi:MAG: FTR1 family protein [Candidatus Bathyarchaeota archaeon]|nr:MAG: FTR1 family protein [Candidatus Bathyarchaeota archaeon]